MTSMLNILNQLDKLTVQQQPYHNHYALKFDENTRIHYSALLLMALLQEGSITGQQQRMLDLWLPAIGLAGRQVELCELATRLAENNLPEAVKCVQSDRSLTKALLLDMMVFSRVAKPLSDNTIHVLEALAGFFTLTEKDVTEIVYFAAFIVGLDVENLEHPDINQDLGMYSVYEEFLFDCYPYRVKRLFSWVKEKKLTDKIPCNVDGLSSVSWLALKNNHYPLPEAIGLLSNLTKVIVDLEGVKVLNEDSLSGFGYIKKLTQLLIRTVYHCELQTLPNEIIELSMLNKITIGRFDYENSTGNIVYQYESGDKFMYVGDGIKNYINKNKIKITVLNNTEMKKCFQSRAISQGETYEYE